MIELTQTVLTPYIGGQLEIQNPRENYLYRGEVQEVHIDGSTLQVVFKWLAKMGDEPCSWQIAPAEDHVYRINLDYVTATKPDDRILYQYHAVGEVCVFFPPNGSRLDPSRVVGLDLS